MKTRILMVMIMLVAGSVFSQMATPESRAAAERLLKTLKMEENFDNTIRQTVNMQLKAMKLTADVPEEKKAKIDELIASSVKTMTEKFSWQSMKGIYVDIYAEVFTAEELQGVCAFYESPAGQKFVAKQPELTKVTMQKMQGLMAEIMPEIQKESVKLTQQLKADSAAKPDAVK